MNATVIPGVTLGSHIQEAKRRAEFFSQSLKDTRDKEAQVQQLLEEDKVKWTQSFADKSTMIEQLERELNTTVTALDNERLKSEALLASRVDGPPSVKATSQKSNDSANTTVPFSPGRSQSLPQGTPSRGDIAESMGHTTTEKNLLAGYLTENKQQTMANRRLELENRRLSEEKDAWRDACKDFEGKLNFRSSQIAEYEAERERLLKVESDTRRYVETLESKIILLKSELEIAQVELKAVLLRASSAAKVTASANESTSALLDAGGIERDTVRSSTGIVEILNRKVERLEREKEDLKSEYQILQLLYKNVQSERDVFLAEHREQRFGFDSPGRISATNAKQINDSDTPLRKSAGLLDEDVTTPGDKWLAAPLWNSSKKTHRTSVDETDDKMAYFQLNPRASRYGGLEPSQPWEMSPSSGNSNPEYHYADSNQSEESDSQLRRRDNSDKPAEILDARRSSSRHALRRQSSSNRSASRSRSRSNSVDKPERYTRPEQTPDLSKKSRNNSYDDSSIKGLGKPFSQGTVGLGVADNVASSAKASKIRAVDIKNASIPALGNETAGIASLINTAGVVMKKGDNDSKVTTPSRPRSAPMRPPPSTGSTALSLQSRRSLPLQPQSQPRKKPQSQSSREITSARLPTAVMSVSIVRSSTSNSIKDTSFGESSVVSGPSRSATAPTPIASKASSVSATATAATPTARRKTDGPVTVSQKQKQITTTRPTSANVQDSLSSSKKIIAASFPAGARVKSSSSKSATNKPSPNNEPKNSQAQECGVEDDAVSLGSQYRPQTDAVVDVDPGELTLKEDEAGSCGSSPALFGSRELPFPHTTPLIDDSKTRGLTYTGSSNMHSSTAAVPRKLQHSHIHKHTHIHTRLSPEQLAPNLHHPLIEAKKAAASAKTVLQVAEMQQRIATSRAPTRLRSKKASL